MAIVSRAVEYQFAGKTFEALLAHDDRRGGRRPLVLVFHAWAGRGPVEEDAARMLARLGYAGLAFDLYGKGVYGRTTEECQALMSPLASDRAHLQARLAHGLEVARAQPEADPTRIAAMGFCFGGLCALDLARTGADMRGAASFHGLFSPPGNLAGVRIKAKVIAFHGFDDPMVSPEDVVALGRELTAAGADWQIHAYGGVQHAFTNPQANDPAFGTVYDRRAAGRAFATLEGFLAECFA
jgi:dienelactone hydrolase